MSDVKWCGHDSRGNPTLRKSADGETVTLDDVPLVAERFHSLTGGASGTQTHLGFLLPSNKISNKVFVPKYYDPDLDEYLAKLGETHSLVTVGSLVEQQALSIATGAEIGKMAYGTGRIPFVRTSDISNWEIKADFKHGVSEEIYQAEKGKADVQAGDILMVRDGTYLIGTTAIVTESDLPMLFQSHLYRLRVKKPDVIDPWLMFACLNTAVVRRQVKSKQFTQDIIDTLGNRVLEIVLPVPKNAEAQRRIAEDTRKTVETRVALRNHAKQIALEVEGIETLSEEDAEVLEEI